MILDILICTYNQGIKKVPSILLPVRNDVQYVVSFKYDSADILLQIPLELTKRPDVSVFSFYGKGIAINRNHALKYFHGDIAIFADDDVRYTDEYINNIFSVFKHSDVDIACFRAKTTENTMLHPYADFSFTYEERPYGTFFSSCEIVIRRNKKIPQFDPRFGLGAPFLACGEEEVFLHDAFKAGLTIRFFPLTVVQTPSGTTGSLFYENIKVQRSKGAVLYILHGFWGALARIIKYAYLNVSHHRISILWQMLKGLFYVKFANNKTR